MGGAALGEAALGEAAVGAAPCVPSCGIGGCVARPFTATIGDGVADALPAEAEPVADAATSATMLAAAPAVAATDCTAGPTAPGIAVLAPAAAADWLSGADIAINRLRVAGSLLRLLSSSLSVLSALVSVGLLSAFWSITLPLASLPLALPVALAAPLCGDPASDASTPEKGRSAAAPTDASAPLEPLMLPDAVSPAAAGAVGRAMRVAIATGLSDVIRSTPKQGPDQLPWQEKNGGFARI